MTHPLRSRRFGWFVSVLSVALAASGVVGGSAKPAQKPDHACALETTERIVAVGDVHGAFERFADILQEAGIVNAEHHWTGEKAILVQTGDMMDRGPDSRKALDLLHHLEIEAAAAGGQVHALIGNHEAMRVQEFLRDASPEEASAFRAADSEKVRERFYSTAAEDARAAATRANKPFDERAFKLAFLQSTPLGYVEMLKAFSPEGEYGKWIKGHDAIIKINGIIFMHGGPSAAIGAMGCAGVNAQVRRELQRVVPAADEKMMIWRSDGPLWYRGYVDGTAKPGEFESVLEKLEAKTIVVAHTTFGSATITPRLDGRLIPIDTGMLGGVHYPFGAASALEIAGDTFTAIYMGKREVIKKGS